MIIYINIIFVFIGVVLLLIPLVIYGKPTLEWFLMVPSEYSKTKSVTIIRERDTNYPNQSVFNITRVGDTIQSITGLESNTTVGLSFYDNPIIPIKTDSNGSIKFDNFPLFFFTFQNSCRLISDQMITSISATVQILSISDRQTIINKEPITGSLGAATFVIDNGNIHISF